jgi:phage gp36-like protein
MSAYATRAELETYGLAPELIATVSNDIVDDCLDATSRFADSYLQTRYELPLVAYSVDLTMAVCEIATYRLLVSLKLMQPLTNDYQIWRDRHDLAVRWLEGIAAGKVSPPGIVSTDPTADGTCLVSSDEVRGW